MSVRPPLILGLLAALTVSANARAGTLSASDIFSQFNAVVFGSFTTTSDVGGRTVVGGNMTGGATFDLSPGNAAASAYSALTVYGNQTGTTSFNVNNGGGISIGGTNAGNFTLNGGGSAYIGSSNTGTLNGATGAVTVQGSNSGTITTSGGGSSVYVGGANGANLSVTNGSGAISVIGSNSGTLSLSNGGTVYAGGSSGNISVNNGSGAVSLNGSNTGQLTLNGGGTAAIAGNTGNVNMNGGTLTYTGSMNGSVNLNGGATAQHVGSVNLTTPTAPTSSVGAFSSTFQTPLTSLSTQLNGQTANSTAATSGNNITFNAAPNSSGTAVFDVNSSLFAPNSTVTLNLDGATTVIINVNVDSCISNACAFTFASSVNFLNPTSYADNVLWNFVNATGLTFSNEFGGSVLAPLAAVTNNGPIDGTLVAASYSGNGELHSYAFNGSLAPTQTGPSGSGSSNPVPEPSSLAVISAALAGIGLLRRRR